MKIITAVFVVFALGCFSNAYGVTFNQEVNAYIQNLEKQAKQQDPSFKGFSAERGRQIFFDQQPHQKLGKISCSSCHTDDVRKQGKNAKTGKVFEPIAPSVNPKAFTSVKNLEKWLKRNFNDVYGREGTAKEKGDSILYISQY